MATTCSSGSHSRLSCDDDRMSASGSKPFDLVLSQATGYGVVVGLGAAFAILMSKSAYSVSLVLSDRSSVAFTRLQSRFTRFKASDAMEFAVASRSIKPGLVCCSITSAWTWSATLLVSSTATYQSGLAAAWWYGAGGTVQIAL